MLLFQQAVPVRVEKSIFSQDHFCRRASYWRLEGFSSILATSNKGLLGARTLLVAPGLTTSSILAASLDKAHPRMSQVMQVLMSPMKHFILLAQATGIDAAPRQEQFAASPGDDANRASLRVPDKQ